jgi:MMP 1-O-methyltransferase
MPHDTPANDSPFQLTRDARTGGDTLTAQRYRLGLRDRLVAMVDRLRHAPEKFERYSQAWAGIPGWLSLTQADRLFHLARTVDAEGDVVEIGSAFGRSAVPLALGTRIYGRGRVFAVDPHTGGIGLHKRFGDLARGFSSLGQFMQTIVRFGVEDWVVPIALPSEKTATVWDGRPIRLLFIDGWHSYGACRRDVLDWGQWVAPGGVMIVHDYDWQDVRRAVDDARPLLPGFAAVASPDGNMAILRRARDVQSDALRKQAA